MIVTLLLTVLCISALQAQTLVVWQKDCSKVYFSLDDEPKTTFTLEELVIQTSTATFSYPLKNMLRYTYESSMVGIDDMKSKGLRVTHRGNDVIVTGLSQGKSIAVYGVDGKLLLTRQSDGTICQTLSLSQFPTGVYVIKADTVNYIFMKQ